MECTEVNTVQRGNCATVVLPHLFFLKTEFLLSKRGNDYVSSPYFNFCWVENPFNSNMVTLKFNQASAQSAVFCGFYTYFIYLLSLFNQHFNVCLHFMDSFFSISIFCIFNIPHLSTTCTFDLFEIDKV